jgi:hypothetical protein
LESSQKTFFLAPGGSKKTDLKQHYNVMEIATSKSQLNALLTSMHMNFIFSGKKLGDDKELTFPKTKPKPQGYPEPFEIDQEYAHRLYCL